MYPKKKEKSKTVPTTPASESVSDDSNNKFENDDLDFYEQLLDEVLQMEDQYADGGCFEVTVHVLSLIHISEPTRPY